MRLGGHLPWLGLVAAAGLFFALGVSAPALGQPFVVEEDVRQHVFWVSRLRDPALFPNDPIADYFQSLASPGHIALYYVATLFTDPISFSKLLPLLLTVLLAGFGYLLGWRLSRRRSAAALGAVLLAWAVWWQDDLASATPRGFATPLLVAFLAFLVGRQWRAALATLAVQALIYPLGCTTMLGTAGLWLLARNVDLGGSRRLTLAPGWRREASWLAAGVALVAILGLIGREPGLRYGPMVTLEQARGMEDFQADGRVSYFHPDPVKFWIRSTHTGLAMRQKDPLQAGLPPLTVPLLLTAGLAGWALAARRGRALAARRGRAPSPGLRPESGLLIALFAASFLLFFVAHLLAFRLYLPARQVQFSLPVVAAFGGGLLLALLIRHLAGRAWPGRVAPATRLLALGAIGLLVLHPPPVGDFYAAGRYQRLYAYLQAQPKDTLVAALPNDASGLPLFAQRPVLVSWEHLLPYQPAFYEPLRRKAEALTAAYFAESPGPILDLAERERVGVLIANLPALEKARRAPDRPLGLELLAERCGALRDRDLVAVPVACASRVATR